jgi:oligoendopeptidase F
LQAEDIRWDLSDLCGSVDQARAEWTSLVERAHDVATRYRGHIDELDASGLRALLDEVDDLEQELSRLQVYSYLRLSMAATDVEANDLATFSRDRGAEIENALVFLGLEWIGLGDDQAERLLASPELDAYEHKLRVEREEKPYVLSEPEEQALNARRPTVAAWMALHDRHISTLEIPFDAGEGSRRTRSASSSRTSTAPTATCATAQSRRSSTGSRRAPTCWRPRTTRSWAIASASTACADSRIRCSRRT